MSFTWSKKQINTFKRMAREALRRYKGGSEHPSSRIRNDPTSEGHRNSGVLAACHEAAIFIIIALAAAN
ncbi:unnamed protein product [Toxocara canis]|uniref:Transposase n=1 Tax=Toxocara canis TaxID=6265 RepID=A0A183VEK9_TOXCA|nr:unnamed protein product [Toxocara canis]